jgi:hypothetical protein
MRVLTLLAFRSLVGMFIGRIYRIGIAVALRHFGVWLERVWVQSVSEYRGAELKSLSP